MVHGNYNEFFMSKHILPCLIFILFYLNKSNFSEKIEISFKHERLPTED